MVAFVKVVRWKCPDCTEVYDTELVNERPIHQHFKSFDYKTGEVVVEQFFMQKIEEYWA